MLETQYQIMHCDPHVTPAYQSITLTWFCLICPDVADFKHTTSRSGKVRLMFMHWNSHYTTHAHAEKVLAQMSSFITQSSWACMQISPLAECSFSVHSQTYLCFCLCSRQSPPTPSTPPLSAVILHSGGSKKVLFLVLLYNFRSDSLWRELNLSFL